MAKSKLSMDIPSGKTYRTSGTSGLSHFSSLFNLVGKICFLLSPKKVRGKALLQINAQDDCSLKCFNFVPVKMKPLPEAQ